MWLHVTNAADWQVCWCTQCCTCIPGSKLYPHASGPSSACRSRDVPLALFRNRAWPKFISNPLRTTVDVTRSSSRERDTQSPKATCKHCRHPKNCTPSPWGMVQCSCHLLCMLLGPPALHGFCLVEWLWVSFTAQDVSCVFPLLVLC